MRKQTEQQLATAALPETVRTPEALLHELRVHQIELETQNETLRETQIALEESRDRYLDLYEFAPVGYLTLAPSGLIAEANLTAATLLGVDRQQLFKKRFDAFVVTADRERWQHMFLSALKQGDKQHKTQTTLMLARRADETCVVHLDCLPIADHAGQPSLRITVTDISERHRAEQMLQASHATNIAILNALPASIAVLDRAGTIIQVNRPWRQFAAENSNEPDGALPNADIGGNYLAVCATGPDETSRDGFPAYTGIKAVIDGSEPGFSMEYRCNSPKVPRWFSMSVTPLEIPGGGVVVAHCDITQRKLAEEALRESGQRFSLALRNAPVSVAIQDSELRYTWAYNQRTLRPEEMVGRFDSDLLTAEQAAHFDAAKRRVLAEGVELNETMWLDRPGGRIFLDVYWEPIRDADGRVYGVGSTSINLTPVKLAQMALEQSKATLEAALASMSEALFITDAEGRFIHTNDAFATFHKFANKAECARTLAEYIEILEVYTPQGEQLPPEQWAVSRALRGETASDAEFMLRRKDSGESWVGSYNFAPILDQVGQIVGSVVTARDITDRKKAELALIEKEAQYRAVIETAADGVWVVDEQGHLIVVNEAYARRSGYSREELLCMRVADLEVDESAEEIHAHMDKVRRQGSDLFETRHRTRSGEVWPVEANVFYSAAAGNRISAFFRDISERKRSESLHQALTAEMEQVMRFHVAQQTVAAIAHELNQPLNAIASYSDTALYMLRTGNPKPDRLLHALEATSQQAQRAGKVVRELLAFVSHGEVETEPVNLNELVRLAIGRLRGNHQGIDQTRLELQLEPVLAPVSAHRMRVEKVIANLIQNGIEAMRGAGIELRDITVAVRTSVDGQMAQVSVRDCGPGIDDETLHRIFDPFFTTKPNGLGMGLAISRAIIEAHGGKLWVESEPGSGAAFHFTLPFAA